MWCPNVEVAIYTCQCRLWDEASFPSLDSPTTTNAVTECDVKGDGKTDDEPALSACLKHHRDVFLPKGFFRLGRTLDLQPGIFLRCKPVVTAKWET